MLHLALLQCPPQPLQPQANLARLAQTAAQARAAGADLLLCPEMYVSGYNIGAEAVQELAQAADGAYFQQVAAIARAQGIAIVYGYPERAPDGAVYNAAQAVDAHGQALLNYRKTDLFGALDRTQFAAGARTQSTLFTLGGWRIGLLICYDLEFPENARRLALAGADALLVPTANMPDYDFVATTLLPVRAYENQICVAYANYCGTENGLHYGGLSGVANADGQLLAQAGREAHLLRATLAPAALAATRQRHQHLADARHRERG